MVTVNEKYKIAQDFKYVGDDWWNWWIWIEGSKVDLDEITHVIYTLHSTFVNPVRKIDDRKSKFKLETEGWGTFTIHAKAVLKNKKEILLEHDLNLEYEDGSKNIE
jgi:transcription initiation factor IIF auxiliary subunit